MTELIGLRWDFSDLTGGTINITRKKHGASGPQHLAVGDRRALRALRKANGGDHVFLSERGDPLGRDAFAKQLAAIGTRAGINRSLCRPHALRHSAGHALANSGKVYAYQLQAIMGQRTAAARRTTCRALPV